MKNEQMLKLSFETDIPAGDQIDYHLSCNIRIHKGELEKRKMSWTFQVVGVLYSLMQCINEFRDSINMFYVLVMTL